MDPQQVLDQLLNFGQRILRRLAIEILPDAVNHIPQQIYNHRADVVSRDVDANCNPGHGIAGNHLGPAAACRLILAALHD